MSRKTARALTLCIVAAMLGSPRAAFALGEAAPEILIVPLGVPAVGQDLEISYAVTGFAGQQAGSLQLSAIGDLAFPGGAVVTPGPPASAAFAPTLLPDASGDQKVLLLSVSDSPEPVAASDSSSSLQALVRVRATDGLNAENEDREQFSYTLRWEWLLRDSMGGVVRELSGELALDALFATRPHRGDPIDVPVTATWDLLDSSGQRASGLVPYTFEVTVTRVGPPCTTHGEHCENVHVVGKSGLAAGHVLVGAIGDPRTVIAAGTFGVRMLSKGAASISLVAADMDGKAIARAKRYVLAEDPASGVFSPGDLYLVRLFERAIQIARVLPPGTPTDPSHIIPDVESEQTRTKPPAGPDNPPYFPGYQEDGEPGPDPPTFVKGSITWKDKDAVEYPAPGVRVCLYEDDDGAFDERLQCDYSGSDGSYRLGPFDRAAPDSLLDPTSEFYVRVDMQTVLTAVKPGPDYVDAASVLVGAAAGALIAGGGTALACSSLVVVPPAYALCMLMAAQWAVVGATAGAAISWAVVNAVRSALDMCGRESYCVRSQIHGEWALVGGDVATFDVDLPLFDLTRPNTDWGTAGDPGHVFVKLLENFDNLYRIGAPFHPHQYPLIANYPGSPFIVAGGEHGPGNGCNGGACYEGHVTGQVFFPGKVSYDGYQGDSVGHEFGHYVMHRSYGRLIPGDVDTLFCANHVFHLASAGNCAIKEGFATFWAVASGSTLDTRYDGAADFNGDCYFRGPGCSEDRFFDAPFDSTVEGRVAMALFDLADPVHVNGEVRGEDDHLDQNGLARIELPVFLEAFYQAGQRNIDIGSLEDYWQILRGGPPCSRDWSLRLITREQEVLGKGSLDQNLTMGIELCQDIQSGVVLPRIALDLPERGGITACHRSGYETGLRAPATALALERLSAADLTADGFDDLVIARPGQVFRPLLINSYLPIGAIFVADSLVLLAGAASIAAQDTAVLPPPPQVLTIFAAAEGPVFDSLGVDLGEGGLATGDLDGDGISDIAASLTYRNVAGATHGGEPCSSDADCIDLSQCMLGRCLPRRMIAIYFGSSNGVTQCDATLVTAAPFATPYPVFAPETGVIQALAVGDANGDGANDLIVSVRRDDRYYHFAPGEAARLLTSYVEIIYGPFERVTTHATEPLQSHVVAIPALSSQLFPPPPLSLATNTLTFGANVAMAGDLDGDGVPDLVVTDSASQASMLQEGGGSGYVFLGPVAAGTVRGADIVLLEQQGLGVTHELHSFVAISGASVYGVADGLMLGGYHPSDIGVATGDLSLYGHGLAGSTAHASRSLRSLKGGEPLPPVEHAVLAESLAPLGDVVIRSSPGRGLLGALSVDRSGEVVAADLSLLAGPVLGAGRGLTGPATVKARVDPPSSGQPDTWITAVFSTTPRVTLADGTQASLLGFDHGTLLSTLRQEQAR